MLNKFLAILCILLYYYNANSRNDLNTRNNCEISKAFHSNQKKIAVLKNNFENCWHLYDVYSDIAYTYHEISTGDYISRLEATGHYSTTLWHIFSIKVCTPLSSIRYTPVFTEKV